MFEMRPEHVADILSVRQVERSVYFVEDVDGCRLEEQQRQDQRQRHKGPLTARQLRQTLLPHIAERYLHLQESRGKVIHKIM